MWFRALSCSIRWVRGDFINAESGGILSQHSTLIAVAKLINTYTCVSTSVLIVIWTFLQLRATSQNYHCFAHRKYSDPKHFLLYSVLSFRMKHCCMVIVIHNSLTNSAVYEICLTEQGSYIFLVEGCPQFSVFILNFWSTAYLYISSLNHEHKCLLFSM